MATIAVASSAMSAGRTRQHPPTMRAPASTHCGASSDDHRRLADPRSVRPVPLLPAVRVDDDRLVDHLARDLNSRQHIGGRATVHAHRDDLRDSGGDGERLGQRLTRAGLRPADRVAQPRRHTEPTHQADQRLGLIDVGHRFDGQHVGSRIGQNLHPGQMPVGQLCDRQPVSPDVLLAVGQRRAVRPDRRGHPPAVASGLLAGRRGEFDAAPHQPLGVVAADSTRRETFEGCLVAGRRRDRRARAIKREVSGHDFVWSVEQ